MQKSIWLSVLLLFLLSVSGCGSSGSVTVVGSTPVALTSSDIASHHIFYSTPVNSAKGYVAFRTYSGNSATGGPAAWDSTANSSTTPLADVSGTWNLSNGQLIFTAQGAAAYQFTCIQKETGYWLMADASNNVTRFYFDQPTAQLFLNSIAVTGSSNIKLGGMIQGTPLTTFNNVSTVAGVAGMSAATFSQYSTAKSPLFGRPVAIATMDGTKFFVLDSGNNCILQVTPGTNGGMTPVSQLTTSSGGVIPFNAPSDMTTDGTNLYVTDTYNFVIKKISPDKTTPGAWIATTLSGNGTANSVDGTGNTLAADGAVTAVGTAEFAGPIGITTDGTNLYVTDNQAIRKVDIATGSVTTLAGSPGLGGSADATGTSARFNTPLRLTTDGTWLYVTDNANYTIRKVSIATGRVSTIAGASGVYGTNSSSGPMTGDVARFNGPNGITTDGAYLYLTDWGPVVYGAPARGQVIFKIALELTAGGYSSAVTRIAGTQNMIATATNQTVSLPAADEALFACPLGLTTNGSALYVADSLNFTLRMIK